MLQAVRARGARCATFRHCAGLHTSRVRCALSEASTRGATAAHDRDITVVGGGVVGLAFVAGLLANKQLPPMQVTLVDATGMGRVRSWAQHKRNLTQSASDSHDGVAWDNRVISMTLDNLAWMKCALFGNALTHIAAIGAYKYLESDRMRGVNRIRVWDGLTDASAEFGTEHVSGASRSETPMLSTMVELSNVQQALLHFIDAQVAEGGNSVQVQLLDDTQVKDISAPDALAWPEVTLENSAGTQTLRTRLLIGADGNNSPVRHFAGIESFGWPYGCKGLVATLRTGMERSAEPLVDGTAYQRFLPTGTLAFLPVRGVNCIC